MREEENINDSIEREERANSRPFRRHRPTTHAERLKNMRTTNHEMSRRGAEREMLKGERRERRLQGGGGGGGGIIPLAIWAGEGGGFILPFFS